MSNAEIKNIWMTDLQNYNVLGVKTLLAKSVMSLVLLCGDTEKGIRNGISV